MLTVQGEDEVQQKISTSAFNTAKLAKALVNCLMAKAQFDEFLAASTGYANGALELVKTLQAAARAYNENKDHQAKIIRACNDIKVFSSRSLER
jgi:hypothetical protein